MKGMERREAPNLGATPRGRMLPLARASGVARATERSACANRLLRARGASRRSTAILAKTVDRPGTEPLPLHRLAVTGDGRTTSVIRRYITETVTYVNIIVTGDLPGSWPR